MSKEEKANFWAGTTAFVVIPGWAGFMFWLGERGSFLFGNSHALQFLVIAYSTMIATALPMLVLWWLDRDGE